MPLEANDATFDETTLEAIRKLPVRRLHVLLAQLMKVASEPRCAESQADGVPCATAHGSCENCARFTEFVASIRDGVLAERPQ